MTKEEILQLAIKGYIRGTTDTFDNLIRSTEKYPGTCEEMIKKVGAYTFFHMCKVEALKGCLDGVENQLNEEFSKAFKEDGS